MSTQPSSRQASRVVAIAGSVVVGLLLALAALGVGTNSVHRIRMLRLIPSTIAVALLPIPAVAWIILLWSRPVSSRRAGIARLAVTLILLVAAVACATLTLLIMFLEPVPRGGIQ